MSLVMPAPLYTVRHSASVSTADTLIELRGFAGGVMVLHSAWCQAETDETNVQLPFRVAHYDTAGATGTALTEEAHQAGFAAVQGVAVYSPGTDPTTILATFAYEAAAIIGPGFQWDGTNLGCLIAPSNSAALELLAAPPGAVTLSFGLRWYELR